MQRCELTVVGFPSRKMVSLKTIGWAVLFVAILANLALATPGKLQQFDKMSCRCK